MRWLLALAASGLASLGLAFTPGPMEFSDWTLPKEAVELQPSLIKRVLDESASGLNVPSEWEFSYSVKGTLSGFDERSESPIGGEFSFPKSSQPIRLIGSSSEASLDMRGTSVIEGRWKGYGPAPERAVIRVESLAQQGPNEAGQPIGGSDLHLPWVRVDGRMESKGVVQTQVWTRPDGSFCLSIGFHYRLKSSLGQESSYKELTFFVKALEGDDCLSLTLPEGLLKKPSEGGSEGECGARPPASLSSAKEVSLSLTRDASFLSAPRWIGQFEFSVGASDPTQQYRATVHSTEGVEASVDTGPTSKVRVNIRIPEETYLSEMKEKGEIVRYLLISLTPLNEKLLGHIVIRCKPPVTFNKIGAERKIYQGTANRRLWKKVSAGFIVTPGIGRIGIKKEEGQKRLTEAEVAGIRASFPTQKYDVVWRKTSTGKLPEATVKMEGSLSNPLALPVITYFVSTLVCREQIVRAVVYGPQGLISDKMIAYREFSSPCPHLPGLKDQESAIGYCLLKGTKAQAPAERPAFGPFPYFTKGSENLKNMVRVYERTP